MEDWPLNRIGGNLLDLHNLEPDAIGLLGHNLIDFLNPLHFCVVEYIHIRIIIIKHHMLKSNEMVV